MTPTDPKLDKIITHKNLDKYLDALSAHPTLQPGPDAPRFTGKEWFHKDVILEFPLGEIAESGLKTLVLIGFNYPRMILPLTGKEGFNAQGLEGKMQVKMELFQALINMRDNLPKYRGRILTDVSEFVGTEHRHIK